MEWGLRGARVAAIGVRARVRSGKEESLMQQRM
jgi:hypothetical protein